MLAGAAGILAVLMALFKGSPESPMTRAASSPKLKPSMRVRLPDHQAHDGSMPSQTDQSDPVFLSPAPTVERASRPASSGSTDPQGPVGSAGRSRVERNGIMEADAVRQPRLQAFHVWDDEVLASRVPGLTPAGVARLREEFEKEAGVGELAQNDPEYPVRWKRAERSLEQKIRLWYGWAAWGAYEHQLALQSEADRVAAMSK